MKVCKQLSITASCTVLIVSAANFSFAVTPSDCLSQEEEKLVNLINEYREQNSLSPVPVSSSLTKVAQWHVIDLHENNPVTVVCNAHSWSNAQPTLWGEVCYTGDHAQAQKMWDKPKEITSDDYNAFGYEIAYGAFGSQATASGALAGWKSSSGHNNVIIEQDIWKGKNWPAMGVGIYEGYAVTWFGDKTDPQGVAVVCGSADGPEINIKGNSNFGLTPMGTPVNRTYTIANVGSEALNLTGDPIVDLPGAGCDEFTVTSQADTPVAINGTSKFTVQYIPNDVGSDTCTVTIENNDSDENPYTFDITGTEGIDESKPWLPAVYQLLL